MTDLNDGYKPGETDESWTWANTSQSTEEIGTTQFMGGFAPTCDGTSRFTIESNTLEPECSGAPSWGQAVFLPDVLFTENGKAWVGVVIMPYNVKDEFSELSAEQQQAAGSINARPWKQAWDAYRPNRDPTSDQNLNTVQASCYPEGMPDSGFTKTVNIDRSKNVPIPVAGELDMQGKQKYVCEWKYTQENGEKVKDAGSPTLLNNDKDKFDLFAQIHPGLRGSGGSMTYGPTEFREKAKEWYPGEYS